MTGKALDSQHTAIHYQENPRARWLAMAIICLCNFLVTLTLSSTFVAVPAIGKDLQASAVLLSWIPTAFLLANVVFLLPFGKLADIRGRRQVFLAGVAVFFAGTLLVGVAPGIGWLLGGRVVQGMGGAMIFACGLAMLLSIFPLHSRGMAIGASMGSLYFGLSCGPLVGGLFTEYLGWRSLFIAQIPVGVGIFFLVIYKLKGEWKNDISEPFDYMGSLLMGVGVVAFSIGLSLLPAPEAWILIVTGVVLLVSFVVQQLGAKHPLVRIRMVISNQILSRSIVTTLLMYASYYPVFFLLSLYLQLILQFTPSQAGGVVFIQAIFMSIFAPLSGRIADRYLPHRIAALGCLLVASGFVVLVGIGVETSVYRVCFSVALIGIGFGLFSAPNNTAAMSAIDPARLGVASALLNLARNFGNIFGSVTVLAIISLLIGQQAIRPEHFPALLQVVHIVFSLSLLYALLACWLCTRPVHKTA